MDLFNNTKGHIAPNPDFKRFYEYLKISKSFHIAQEVRSGSLSKQAATQLIPDFANLEKVAGDFKGVLTSNSFEEWWQEDGIQLFGNRGLKPAPRIILELPPTFMGVPHMLQKAAFEFYPRHLSHTVHANFYVEIPKSASRAELMRFVNSLHTKVKKDGKRVTNPPKYKLVTSKVNDQTLDLGLKFLKLYTTTDLSMWRIGSKIGISKTLSDQVDPYAKRQPHTSAPVTRTLDVMANKLKHKAIALAENAARGIFPCTTPLPFSPPDYR